MSSKTLSCLNPITFISRINSKKNEYIYEGLRRNFKSLGSRIANKPFNFVTFPIFMTIIFLTAFQRIKLISDFDLIFSSPVSEAILNRQYIEKLFPLNMSNNFNPQRKTRKGRFGSIIITARDGGTVLRHSIFEDLKLLDEKIKKLRIEWDSRYWKYEDICALERKERCFKTITLSLGKFMKRYESGNLTFKYPIGIIGGLNESLLEFGGVILSEQNDMLSAKSVSLSYHLDTSSESKDLRSSLWEEAFSDLMERLQFEDIIVDYSISSSFAKQLEQFPLLIIPYAPVSGLLVLLFSVLTSLSPDWLRSKPWTGISTVMSSGLAAVSGFGLMLYCGIPFVSLDVLVPFLVLGIGMDDTFVMLSAWKQTDPKRSTEERLGETYFEAAIPITLTSTTNVIAFIVGWLFSTHMGLKSFCLYMTACLIFDYIYQITFVGACLAYCAYAEKDGRHSLFFFKLKKDSETDGKKLFSKLFCATYPTDDKERPSIISTAMFDEFWKLVGKVLTWSTTKVIVICLYFAYIAVSIWGLGRLSSTDTHKSLLVENSPIDRYFDASFKYYDKNRESLHFIINTTVDYADPEVQRKIFDMTRSFEADEFIADSEFTESWLKSYLKFINHRAMIVLLNKLDMTNQTSFIDILRRFFLRNPKAERFKNDIMFNEDYTQIIASRFFCQANITKSKLGFRLETNRFKEVVSEAPYPIIMFHPMFPLFDGFNSLFPTAIKTLCIIAIVVTIVSWILLPSFICTLCICYSVFSIGIGIVGLMSLCGITLSVSTLLILIAASGLSVDCAAHIACAYISQKNLTPNEKVRNAVSLVSMPIFQGSLTTVLSVVAFFGIPLSSVVSVVKLIALVCSSGVLHGVIILPVVMFLLESAAMKCKKSSKEFEIGNDSNKSGIDNAGLAVDAGQRSIT